MASLSATAQPPAPSIEYLQNFLFIGVGSFSVVSTAIGVTLVWLTKSIRTKHPLFVCIYVGGFMTALSFVLLGSMRLQLLAATGAYPAKQPPSECLKRPAIVLYYAGAQTWSVFHFFVSFERLFYIAAPENYKHNWTENFAKCLILGICCFIAVSLALGAIATMSVSATGVLQEARCPLADLTGHIYGFYHFGLLAGLSTLSVVFAIVSFVLVKHKIGGLKSRSASFKAVMPTLNLQYKQTIMGIFVTLAAYLLEVVTYVNNLFSTAQMPMFPTTSLIGRLFTVSYCFSCGLNIFVLATKSPELRTTVIKLFSRKPNVVQPQRMVTVF